MRALALVALSVVLALQPDIAGAPGPDCEAVGAVRFICGHSGPEDLVAVPGAPWVVASGYTVDDGSIRIVNTQDFATAILLPTPVPRERPDRETYAACPGPVAGVEQKKFRTHGLAIRPGRRQVHTLFAVHHGTRESVEVFELDVRTVPPGLTWVGCVVAPPGTNLNAVSALPDGFVATSYQTDGRAKVRVDAFSAEISGELWEWHAGTGWTLVPGSDAAGPNGLDISKDGRWLYIGTTSSQSVIRLSRGQSPPVRQTVPVGFAVDNVHWAPDGSLLVAGFILSKPGVPGSSRVVRLDPDTLKVSPLVDAPSLEKFSVSTAAVQVGDEIWVGSVRGDRIARYPSRGAAPGTSAKARASLRTVDGQPDLQGVWTFGTMTPLERPIELVGRMLTAGEVARFEQQAIQNANADRRLAIGTDADVSKAYNQFWYEGKRLIGDRTSLIVDPPDGRIPPLTPEGQARASRAIPIYGFQDSRILASWLDRGLWERCITRGLPQVMLPAQYNENYQILQTRDHVVVHAEMIHDARVIPLDGRPHLSSALRQWMGDSRGRWEGDTLVVETRNFTSKTSFFGSADNLRLVERFRRVDEHTLEYQVTIDDPATFTKPWTIAFPARKNLEKMYEYACHEGNYAMGHVLAGSRAKEKEAASVRAK